MIILDSFTSIIGGVFSGSLGFYIGLVLIVGCIGLVIVERKDSEGELEKMSKSQKKTKRIMEQILRSGAMPNETSISEFSVK